MPKSFLQTDNWVRIKESYGWQISKLGDLIGLKKTLILGKSMLYYPEIDYTADNLALIKTNIKSLRQDKTNLLVRFEFLEKYDEAKVKQLAKLGLVKSFEDVQPEYRQWVNLTLSEEELLAQMEKRCRNAISRATKEGVEVVQGNDEAMVKRLFDLYRKTGQRSSFETRDINYFLKIVGELKDYAQIYIATSAGRDYAGAMIVSYAQTASDLYAGTDIEGPYGTASLLQWRIIQDAKRQGYEIYDFIAIAPPDQPNHKYAGITKFKTQFGGESVRLLGSWDLVVSGLWYRIYSVIEKYRRKL